MTNNKQKKSTLFYFIFFSLKFKIIKMYKGEKKYTKYFKITFMFSIKLYSFR